MRKITPRSLAILLFCLLLLASLLLAEGIPALDAGNAGAIAVLGLGFLLGLRHTLDADHLVAIATIVSERRSLRSASWTGAMWGLGHTLSLLAAGVLILLLRVKIPEAVVRWLELPVAVMIVGLGFNLLWQMLRHGGMRLHAHAHSHGELRHAHLHLHFADRFGEEPPRHYPVRTHRKPFLVGMVHGLAGSAALMLLVLTEISSPLLGLFYIAIFGIGWKSWS